MGSSFYSSGYHEDSASCVISAKILEGPPPRQIELVGIDYEGNGDGLAKHTVKVEM